MKKTNSFIALILALGFLTPLSTLAACQERPTLEPPSLGTDSTLPDGSQESETPPQENETPPQNNGNGNGNNSSTENGSVSQTPTPAPTPTPNPTPTPPTTQPTVKYSSYIRCTGNSVNLRSGAGTGYAVLGAAEKNETYALVGKSGEWYQTYYRGETAYISASYAAVLKLETSQDERTEKVISEGYKLLGVPYVYGAVRLHDGKGRLLSGFSTQKFDCSSLVHYMFYKGAGTLLDVTTRTQVKQGKYVARADLQRGDCIYFTNESRQHLSGVERVGHVAVYLGDNYILHTASDYARIEQISAQRWKFYIEARRFL